MIGSNIVGNDVAEVAAQYMAEYARLELWMGRREPPLGFPRKFEIARIAAGERVAVYEAWTAFESAYQASGKKVDQVRGQREELKAPCAGLLTFSWASGPNSSHRQRILRRADALGLDGEDGESISSGTLVEIG
ncbi:hypothetical protein I6A84_31135 [Frankia sp. CNm7]|uniref:Uncharacterized protein n=1 Tax=Frankia nepalensis TaxID=1836974 RepID=A0A937RBG1_9ACTN|nr:hypothetical protein [Frankia nepalensis]MBL7500247.1 hypothetical protein [Frankia nepalensis]MBL7513523.1 hypothetical protein [Frankia nepalensis]MBL7522420.1 hypothetical protein [Frankia nepalensis]MBL7628986.1 hypothetical protein [Frankia nepalensis]